MVTKQHIKIDDFLKDLDENEISYIEQEVLGAMEDSIFMVLQEAKEMGAYKKFLVDNKLEEGEYKMVLKEPDDDDEEDEKVSSPITTKKSLSSQKLTMEFDPIQSLYNAIAELSYIYIYIYIYIEDTPNQPPHNKWPPSSDATMYSAIHTTSTWRRTRISSPQSTRRPKKRRTLFSQL